VKKLRAGDLTDRAAALIYYGVLAIWSASGYVAGFMRAGNAIYGTVEGRRSGRPCM
jgi:membrane protein